MSDDDEMMTDDSWQLCCHYLIHLIITQINIKILWMKWFFMREKNENNMRKMWIMFEKIWLKSFKLKLQCASYKKSSCIFFKDDPPFSILHFPVAFFPHHFLFPLQIMVLGVVYFLCNFFWYQIYVFFRKFFHIFKVSLNAVFKSNSHCVFLDFKYLFLLKDDVYFYMMVIWCLIWWNLHKKLWK